jgi:predicted TIM-barrel enzyme
MAKAAAFFLSDGIILSGKFTGSTPDSEEFKTVKQVSKIPVLIGSGISVENIEAYFPHGDGFIVGSALKYDGFWENDIDPERLQKLVKKANTLRSKMY